MTPVAAPAGSDDRRTRNSAAVSSRMPGPPGKRAVTRLMLAGAFLVGCGDDGDGGATARSGATGAASGPPSVEAVAAGVCDALVAAEAGDLATAREAFDHGPLHALAGAAIEVDRAVAARLLEAKEAVEAGIADDGVAVHQVSEDLRSLTVVAREALSASGLPSPPLCERAGP